MEFLILFFFMSHIDLAVYELAIFSFRNQTILKTLNGKDSTVFFCR